MSTDFHSSLILFGCTGIAIGFFVLAMPRHYAIAFGSNPSVLRTQTLRFCAWFTLLASLVLALADWKDGITLILWFALLSFHSFAATMILTYAARGARIALLAPLFLFSVGILGAFTSAT